MSVSVLLVEGKLDAEVLSPVLGTLPVRVTLEAVGSKSSLKPRARDRRQGPVGVSTCYVRDRDFDFDPPVDSSQPTVDSRQETGGVLGWRWSRHELENYLLEPRLVEAATGWSAADFERELLAAARNLQHYNAARWAVGIARRSLPPFNDLPTRPAELTNEVKTSSQTARKLPALPGLCSTWRPSGGRSRRPWKSRRSDLTDGTRSAAR